MLGPEFLRVNCPGSDCQCDVPSCKAAGYFPGQGALTVPAGVGTVLNTPQLFSPQKKQRFLDSIGRGEKVQVHLYAWHFFLEHREKNGDGKWELSYNKMGKTKYYDLERKKAYVFPPPRNTPESFLSNEYFSDYVRPQDRWAAENRQTEMPTWMLNMLALDAEHSLTTKPPAAKLPEGESKATLQRKIEMWEARACYLKGQLTESKEYKTYIARSKGKSRL